jgi:hypothetical protein
LNSGGVAALNHIGINLRKILPEGLKQDSPGQSADCKAIKRRPGEFNPN